MIDPGWQKSQTAQTAIQLCVEALKDKNQNVRKHAVMALRSIGGPSIVEHLITVLNDSFQNVRHEAVAALAEIADVHSLDGLINALNDQSHDVGREAAVGLGNIGDPQAVKALVSAIPLVGYEAVRSLDKINPDWPQSDYARAAVPYLIDALQQKGQKPSVDSHSIIQTLGKIKDARALDSLIEALKEHKLTGSAAEALAEIGDPKSIHPLVLALELQIDQKKVAMALKTFGDAAFYPLVEALNNRATGAAFALGVLADTRAIAYLAAALEDKDTYVPDAVHSLGEMKAVEALVSALTHKDEWVRYKAAEALGKIKDPLAVSPLCVAFNDKNPFVRREVATALGNIGTDDAINRLIYALDDNDESVRNCVARALGNTRSPEVIEPLVAALRKYEGIEVVTTLGAIGDERAIAALIDFAFKQSDLNRVVFDREKHTGYKAVESIERILERSASKSATGHLQVLSNLNLHRYVEHYERNRYDTTVSTKYMGPDCFRVREIARNELRRRGLII
jgi:HEAT repeat protein